MSDRITSFLITMAILIIGVTLHEFAHAFAADRLGDDTPRRQGRLSLLPPDHLDPLGTLMMALTAWFGFGLGWGKPVLTNPSRFRNPRRDQGVVAFAGPLSNILQAVAFALVIRFIPGLVRDSGGYLSPLGMFLILGVTINLALAFFNLLPLSPLDGSWIVTALLPARQAYAYQTWMARYGPLVFLLLVLVFRDLVGVILEPPVAFARDLLLSGAAF